MINLSSLNLIQIQLHQSKKNTRNVYHETKRNSWIKHMEMLHILSLSLPRTVKVNESRHIALFVFSGSIKKLFSIDFVKIYLFSMFFSIGFSRWKNVELPHIAHIVRLFYFINSLFNLKWISKARPLIFISFYKPFMAKMFSKAIIQRTRFIIVIRNGKIIWKVVWIEYYLRLNLSSRRY